ncbi:MAG: ABC transporter substrate-binding protein [Rhodospirillales bacterium]
MTFLRNAAAATLVVAATLAAGGAGAQQAADTLRVRLNADIRSTDPGVNRDGNTDAVVLHVVEGLVAFRDDTSVGPMLAERIDVAADSLSYTFRLREGVRFHNGAPLTSADVAFAWKRYMDPATQWRCLPEFDGRGVSKVTAIETPDPRTVVFRLERPAALFLTAMARVDCGSAGIWHRDSLDADGKWKEPVGTGPFRLGEWRRGQFVELVRNDAYAARTEPRSGHTGDKTPRVGKVRFVIVPDASAAKAALLAGNLDVVTDVSANDAKELAARNDVKVESVSTMDLQAILFQTTDKLLSDVRVRRALALSLDVGEIVATVSEGRSKANRSPVPPPSSYHTPVHAAVPATNLDQARRLLAEAGYKGEPIRLATTQRFPALFDIAVMAQAMAQRAGIRIELDVVDWAALLDRYTKGDYQAMVFTFSARLDPSLSFDMFTGPKATEPRKAWDNPEVQALLRESFATVDRARRQAIYDDLLRRLLDEVPIVALYSSVDTGAVRRNVSGYAGWALGQPRLWGVSFAN